jgi:site-specific recombinase
MNWLIFSLNFALADTGFCRIAPSGDGLAMTWESQTRSAVTICRSQSVNVLGAIYTGVQVAGAIFLVCAGSNVQLHVWPVVARIMAANSMRVFGCG